MEKILGKGENAGYQHFPLFPKCFQKPPYLGSLKVRIVWYRVSIKTTATVHIPWKMSMPNLNKLFNSKEIPYRQDLFERNILEVLAFTCMQSS